MSGAIRELGNQGARFGNYVVNNVDAPSYKYWFVLPLVIISIIGYFIGYFFLPKWNSKLNINVQVDASCTYNCETRKEKIDGKWYYLGYLIIPWVIGLIVAGIVYKIGFSIKNPKAAAIGMGVKFLTD